ncbi:CMP-sialic acid transporter 3 [Zea mays]|uniref:CMP-sialic acid transporter 3 n=1 Tax=Zea mays TaxID=4577 RepID=A0A1D6Q4F6_MAIZE|nr:CMP-sialic acid transporter 3 [Zea mays]
MQRNGVVECSVCRSRVVVPSPRSVSRAYDKHRNKMSSKFRALNVFLVVGDCILVGLQPILVFMSKVDGKFQFSPISVNFLTEVMKVIFAVVMLIIQVCCSYFLTDSRKQKVGEKPLLARSTFIQAARNNVLLAVPALLYAINNYLKFIMQVIFVWQIILYFNPATVKMLSTGYSFSSEIYNEKEILSYSGSSESSDYELIYDFKLCWPFSHLFFFEYLQWEALALLLIGISINQLRTVPVGNTAFGLPVTAIAYIYTLIFVTVPSVASVYNEYALKSQYDTSIYLQNLFLYGYGAIFNLLGILGTVLFQGPESFNILRGHSRATIFLICNNAAQGILSSFFFKYADTILKKYSSTVATIFTGLASAAFLGHSLTINFLLGISVVFISMHQFFSPLAKVKDDKPADSIELEDTQNDRPSESSFVNMTAGAADDASHRIGTDERQPLLPI